MGRHFCVICGYVYDYEIGNPENNIEPETSFDNVPNDWLCPICGAGKLYFEETTV